MSLVPQFDYQIVRTKRINSPTTIRIHPEKGVVVRAPFWVPLPVIKRFMADKSDWIQKHLNKNQVSSTQKNYQEGEEHLYFGQYYPIKFNPRPNVARTAICLKDGAIQIDLYRGHLEDETRREVKDSLLRWYLETGISVITEKVNYFSNRIGVSYSRIDIKKVSSIWGSCSPGNRLCFNRKLIMAPHEVVDYVVIHEVCHLIHRNHSSRFWGLVASLDPAYKEHRRWLYRNHRLLLI